MYHALCICIIKYKLIKRPPPGVGGFFRSKCTYVTTVVTFSDAEDSSLGQGDVTVLRRDT